MASNFDMVALSRRYAHGTETDPSISPTVLRICQRVEIPAFIY